MDKETVLNKIVKKYSEAALKCRNEIGIIRFEDPNNIYADLKLSGTIVKPYCDSGQFCGIDTTCYMLNGRYYFFDREHDRSKDLGLIDAYSVDVVAYDIWMAKDPMALTLAVSNS